MITATDLKLEHFTVKAKEDISNQYRPERKYSKQYQSSKVPQTVSNIQNPLFHISVNSSETLIRATIPNTGAGAVFLNLRLIIKQK